jgi:hypothetical protein
MDNQNNKYVSLPINSKNKLITDYYKPVKKIIKGYNQKTNHFHCLECGIDMGNYQGQLCRKSFCDGVY